MAPRGAPRGFNPKATRTAPLPLAWAVVEIDQRDGERSPRGIAPGHASSSGDVGQYQLGQNRVGEAPLLRAGLAIVAGIHCDDEIKGGYKEEPLATPAHPADQALRAAWGTDASSPKYQCQP